MAFELKDLPYSHDALETLGMSKETLEFHHDLHHKLMRIMVINLYQELSTKIWL